MEYKAPVLAMCIHEAIQHAAVLKAGIHTLPVKRHDGVGGVADEGALIAEMPLGNVRGDERGYRVAAELLQIIRHQRQGVGEMLLEEIADTALIGERFEAVGAFEGHEEGTGK